jgi:hypothetical protein
MKLRKLLFIFVVLAVLIFTGCELDGTVTVTISGFEDGVDGITYGVSTVSALVSDSTGVFFDDIATINDSSVSFETSTVAGGTTVAGGSVVTADTIYSVTEAAVNSSVAVVAGDTTISFSWPSDFEVY